MKITLDHVTVYVKIDIKIYRKHKTKFKLLEL